MSTFGVEHAASYAESTDRFLVHGSGTIPAFRVLAEPVEHDKPRSAAGSCGSVAMREVFSDMIFFPRILTPYVRDI